MRSRRPEVVLPSRRPGRRADLGRAARVRRRGERRRDGPRARRPPATRPSSSPRPAARSTASASGPPARTTRAGRCRRTASAKLCRRGVPGRLEPPARDAAHTPSLRERVRAAPGGGARGRRRRDLPRTRWPRARRRRSSATGSRRATSSTSTTSSARCSPRRPRGGVFNVGSGARRPCSSCTSGAARSPATDASRRSEPAREGDVQRSVLDVSRAERELGWRPEVGLDEGLRADLGLGALRGRKERAAAGRSERPPWITLSPRPSSSGPGAPRPSSLAGIAAVELVLLIGAGIVLLGKQIAPHVHTAAARDGRGDAKHARVRSAAEGDPRRSPPTRRQARAREDEGDGPERQRRPRRRRASPPARHSARGYPVARGRQRPEDRLRADDRRCTARASAAEALRFQRDLNLSVVAPLDGMTPAAAEGRAAGRDPRRRALARRPSTFARAWSSRPPGRPAGPVRVEAIGAVEVVERVACSAR